MGLKYDARLDLSALSDALEKRGLTPGGRGQKAVDEAVIRYCDPKVPFRTGTLKHSAITASAIGDGMIVYALCALPVLRRGVRPQHSHF